MPEISETDAMATVKRESRTTPSSMFRSICATVEWCRHDVLDATLDNAIEIAREGREGRRKGTLFTLGDAEAVLASSRALILDPLAGHSPAATTSPIQVFVAPSKSSRKSTRL
jgi:DNA integrity scanning protein DisA with diadenylate cyclase activity